MHPRSSNTDWTYINVRRLFIFIEQSITEVTTSFGLAVLIVFASFIFPVGAALAQDAGKYQCTHGDLVRRVEIYTEPGVTVPCEVHYFKDTEAPGQSEVLWSAQSQAGYCEQKATEFVARLEGWGWDCNASDAAAPAAAPCPVPRTC